MKKESGSNGMLKNLALGVVSLFTSLYAAEFLLQRVSLGPAYVRSWQSWVPYDTRDRLQFILDERDAGQDAFPAPNALLFIKEPLRVRGEPVVPLGGVANVLAVGGNEGGLHSAFVTDEAGFNNPKGTWPLKDARNVFLVGDSFTYGDCVKQGQDLGSHLRKQVADVVNLGARGNGPLQELASIREYVPSGRVGHVFWMFYERNDLIDLRDAKRDPILMRYLDEGFRQDLLGRRQEVDATLRDYLEERIRRERSERPVFLPALRAKIRELLPRKAEGNAHEENAEGKQQDAAVPDMALFKEVVAHARREVEGKGGKFVFVYLPSFRRFSGESLHPWANHKEAVLQAVQALDIPIIDIEPEFRKIADPLSLFPFRLNGHYNDAGYALVSRVIAEHLKAGESKVDLTSQSK